MQGHGSPWSSSRSSRRSCSSGSPSCASDLGMTVVAARTRRRAAPCCGRCATTRSSCLLCDRDIDGRRRRGRVLRRAHDAAGGPGDARAAHRRAGAARPRVYFTRATTATTASCVRPCRSSARVGCATTSPGSPRPLAHELEWPHPPRAGAVAPVPAELAERPRLRRGTPAHLDPAVQVAGRRCGRGWQSGGRSSGRRAAMWSGWRRPGSRSVAGDAAGGAGDARSVVVLRAVGSEQADGPLGAEGEGPAALVDEVVVRRTKRDEVVQISGPASLPRHDVVDPAAVEPDGAARMGAGGVHRPQRSALMTGGDALVAADVDGDTGGIEDDGNDRGIAALRRSDSTGSG